MYEHVEKSIVKLSSTNIKVIKYIQFLLIKVGVI